MSDVRVLFANFPWWFPEPHLAGVRAGSRWPFRLQVPSTPDNWKPGSYCPYPMFLGAAATYVKAKCPGVKVDFRDSIALRESYSSFFDAVGQDKYDYIFVESATPSWEHDWEVICQLAARTPRSKIVVTGTIATLGEALLAKPVSGVYPIHAVIKGEYERGSVRVINGESGVIPFDIMTAEDMNSAPPPVMGDIYVDKYWDACPVGQQAPHLQTWSSRGCWAKCIFCAFPAVMTSDDADGTKKRSVRLYTPEFMESWVLDYVKRFKFKSIYDDSDLFNHSDRHTLAIAEVYRKTGLPWTAMCRADTIKKETWKAMKDCGCVGVKIGVESANQYVLDHIVNKRLKIEAVVDTLYYLKSIGMTVHGTFTVGLPGETKEQMQETLDFIKRMPFDTYQCSGTAEIEGTPMSTLREKGELAKYAGAKMDGEYSSEKDGAVKGARLALEMAK